MSSVAKTTDEPENRIKIESKYSYAYKNPCNKEQEISLKCIEEYGRDKEKCGKQFLNYRNCKDFWAMVAKDRKSKGIKPHIPIPEEREQVKKEYLPRFTF